MSLSPSLPAHRSPKCAQRSLSPVSFTTESSLLLVEATKALSEALGTPAPISAVLHLTIGERDQPGCREHTFVNAAFRP